jgi:hypothetical protein
VAARRLVVVMLVLLGISTLVAALLPPPKSPDSTTPKHAQRRAGAAQDRVDKRASPSGLLLVARIPASSARPKRVGIERGDELRLTVTAPFGADVEIPGFGLTTPVTPYAGAQFDLFATDRGNYAVRIADSGRVVGRVLVARPGHGRCGVATPATPQGRASAPACDLRGERVSAGRGRSSRRP